MKQQAHSKTVDHKGREIKSNKNESMSGQAYIGRIGQNHKKRDRPACPTKAVEDAALLVLHTFVKIG